MNYHIVYNNFKDYAELLIKNIDFSKANINKVLFLHIGDEEAISEIIENTNFKNTEFYIKDEDSIYSIIETLYNGKVHKFLEYNNMEFDLIIANPPYGSLGNPIISETIKHLVDNGTASVLMPLSCYKKNELYRHVETFELANPKLFKDASVQDGLCITSLKKDKIDNFTMQPNNDNFSNSLLFKSLDQSLISFYIYNWKNNKGLVMNRMDSKSSKIPTSLNIELDFVDSGRCVAKHKGAGYHPKTKFGYKYNVTKVDITDDFPHCAGVIHFNTKQAKDNFCKYAYNWDNNKWDCLESLAMSGLRASSVSSDYFFWIPQIDWDHISDTDLWKEGKYDEAVLDVMGLRWDDKKETIIKA